MVNPVLHLTREKLNDHLDAFAASPKDHAQVEFICARPYPGGRSIQNHVVLSTTEGVVGDRWKTRPWLRLPNGSPDPRIQVSLCSPRLLAILETSIKTNIEPKLAIGDNFVVDLDFSESNLPVGQRLRIGSAIIEVSDVYNDACTKFEKRFGTEVLNWIRDAENRTKRLRGIFARVIQEGEVKLNDLVSKIC